MSDILLIARAWNFSAERHAKQSIKARPQESLLEARFAEAAEQLARALRDKPK